MKTEEAKDRYRRLFETAPLVAYSLDGQLRTLYISPYCLEVFGYTDQEIRQNPLFWDQHIHPDDRQLVLYKRERRLQDSKAFSLEYRTIHQDGSVHHIINHTIPVLRDNRIHCIDGFIFDITARKYLEEQLVLTEKIKLLNDMSLSVAHEIRNPLTSIGGFARLLERRLATGDPNRLHLEIILKEVARLEETLNRVLDNLKTIRLKRATADINEILTGVLAQLDHEFHDRGIKLTTDLGDDLREIEVDRYLMEQALCSVLRTTLQGMSPGSDLTVSTVRNHLHVSIMIHSTHLDARPLGNTQLFFPFYREPGFDNGVGLPLSQQIIAEHGGNVVLKNGNDRASSLVITLPIPRSTQQTEMPLSRSEDQPDLD